MNLDDYIAKLPEHRRGRFLLLAELIESLYPFAKCSMQYKMPTYHTGTGWVAIANRKHYISFYTCNAEYLAVFKQQHPEIKTGKGCIKFQDHDHLPLADLSDVIQQVMTTQQTA